MNRIIHHQQLFQLIVAHYKELIREPGVLFWGIVFPILMSLGLGIAFTKKTEIVRDVAVIETIPENLSPDSAISRLDILMRNGISSSPDNPRTFSYTVRDSALGAMTLRFHSLEWDEAIIRLKRGNLNLILEERGPQLLYHFDPLNPDAQLTYLKLSNSMDATSSQKVNPTGTIQPLTLTGTRYIDFLVPGLIAMGIMMSCMWGLSYGIIEKRSKKLLRRMVATPMRKSHFLIAMMTVRIGMNTLEAALLFVFANMVFGITIQGGIGALAVIFLAGNIVFTGIAIFISSHTANTEIGNGYINAVVMPMMVLSGIFFSYHNFPDWSIPVIQKLPLTLLADGLRGIFIEGAGLREVFPAVLTLTFVGILFFSVGLRIFKWH